MHPTVTFSGFQRFETRKPFAGCQGKRITILRFGSFHKGSYLQHFELCKRWLAGIFTYDLFYNPLRRTPHNVPPLFHYCKVTYENSRDGVIHESLHNPIIACGNGIPWSCMLLLYRDTWYWQISGYARKESRGNRQPALSAELRSTWPRKFSWNSPTTEQWTGGVSVLFSTKCSSDWYYPPITSFHLTKRRNYLPLASIL